MKSIFITNYRRSNFVLLLLIVISTLFVNPVKAGGNSSVKWNAKWISYPAISGTEYGVYHFRKQFNLDTVPNSFIIHVSGDSRYKFFVNGHLASYGPAKSDVTHLNYETVDVVEFLQEGDNIVSSVIWNYGELNPFSVFSVKSAFVLQGSTIKEQIINTDTTWKCFDNKAYSPIVITEDMVNGYYVAGPGENVEAAKYPWKWKTLNYDDTQWSSAHIIGRADQRNDRWTGIWPAQWMLVERDIPLMELKKQRIEKYRIAEGIKPPKTFPKESYSFSVRSHSKVRILFDQTYLTTAFPVIKVNKGAGAKITLSYTESLFYKGTHNKGNRDEVEGKEFKGTKDVFIADGGARTFEPLNWRAFRYMELIIETQDEELEFIDIYSIFTAYPFELKSEFEANSDVIDKILNVGWRTARVCAHDSYMDTPFYERLQYVGDTRIQGLISIYNSGDTRLLKRAISQLNNSRIPEGLTYSRYPSREMQFIPPFSLWWIGMVHDYWMYVPDSVFVKEMLPGVRSILSFFNSFQASSGSIENLPWWNFMDWTKDWDWGIPVVGESNRTASIDILLYQAYIWASEIEKELGNKGLSQEYSSEASLLKATIFKLYFNEEKGLFGDTENAILYSQQTNTLAITSGLVDSKLSNSIMGTLLTDTTLNMCTSYFQYYLHSALRLSGYGDTYLQELDGWKEQLALGLTTWRETPEPSRSDCHAWSSSPNIELYRTVLGINSAAPAFSKVLIQPFIGNLKEVSGSIPHPNGIISVSIKDVKKGKTKISITLPKDIEGELIWKDKTYKLTGKESYIFEI